jgi:hypothetical protein
VSELGGKLKLENANPGTLVQVVIPNTSAKNGRASSIGDFCGNFGETTDAVLTKFSELSGPSIDLRAIHVRRRCHGPVLSL